MPLHPLMRSAAIPSRDTAKFFLAIVFNPFFCCWSGCAIPTLISLCCQAATPVRALDSRSYPSPGNHPLTQEQHEPQISVRYRSTEPVCVVCFWLTVSARFQRGGCVELANSSTQSLGYRVFDVFT